MSEPNWKLIKDPISNQVCAAWRCFPDGREQSCSLDDEYYLKWLEEGNEPEPADE